MAERGGEPEFYVGYLPKCPPGIAARTRRAVGAIAALAWLTALAVLTVQAPLAPAAFEFGIERRFRGTLRAEPVPLLAVERPAAPAGVAAVSHFLLVAPGKHGARPDVAGLEGRLVELAGSLIYREGQTMIELVPGSIVPLAEPPAPTQGATDLGTHTLVGEIVDSKCHLGVMNPGDGKTHRECATRCISGGIPPMLRTTAPDGTSRLLLLVGEEGEMVNREILDRVAEPVEVTGRVEQLGELLVIYADPKRIRRLGAAG
jgi:hypothetical protein